MNRANTFYRKGLIGLVLMFCAYAAMAQVAPPKSSEGQPVHLEDLIAQEKQNQQDIRAKIERVLGQLALSSDRLEERRASLYRELEQNPDNLDTIKELNDDLVRHSAAYQERQNELSILLSLLEESLRRTGQMEQTLDQNRQAKQSGAAPAEGTWELTLFPQKTKAFFVLRQKGTMLEGEFSMEEGFTGSLVGTFVNDKVTVERVDSKLGRAGKYTGRYNPQTGTITGSWFLYDISGPGPVSGEWVANRSESEED